MSNPITAQRAVYRIKGFSHLCTANVSRQASPGRWTHVRILGRPYVTECEKWRLTICYVIPDTVNNLG